MTPDYLKLAELAQLVRDWQVQTDRLHGREAGRLPSPALCQAAADTAFALQKIRCFDVRAALGGSTPPPLGPRRDPSTFTCPTCATPTACVATQLCAQTPAQPRRQRDRRQETPAQYRARVAPEWRVARRQDDPDAVLVLDRDGDLQPSPWPDPGVPRVEPGKALLATLRDELARDVRTSLMAEISGRALTPEERHVLTLVVTRLDRALFSRRAPFTLTAREELPD